MDIVHWPIHPEAPFQFKSTDHYTLHPKEKHSRESLKQLLAQINPTAIVCSGWMDSDYNAVAKAYQKHIPVVLTLDNWWTGSLKQRLAALTAPWFIHRRFNRAWVPGEPQIPFAQKLGFSGHSLATGFYCADPKPFQAIYEKRQETSPSKKILYIGRYLDVKGVRELWSAFIQLSDEFPEWELHCIGTGELWDSRVIHPKIIHHGFKQPRELEPHYGCRVLRHAQQKGTLGVVLHEMAIAGLPLLATQLVGASSQFLEPWPEWNHLRTIKPKGSSANFLSKNDFSRKHESTESHKLGINHMPEDWSRILLSLIVT